MSHSPRPVEFTARVVDSALSHLPDWQVREFSEYFTEILNY